MHSVKLKYKILNICQDTALSTKNELKPKENSGIRFSLRPNAFGPTQFYKFCNQKGLPNNANRVQKSEKRKQTVFCAFTFVCLSISDFLRP